MKQGAEPVNILDRESACLAEPNCSDLRKIASGRVDYGPEEVKELRRRASIDRRMPTKQRVKRALDDWPWRMRVNRADLCRSRSPETVRQATSRFVTTTFAEHMKLR